MLSIRYRHTNCHFVRTSSGKLLAVDAGWPCTLFEYARHMKHTDCRLQDIAWAIVTHFHMDHAGLIGEFLDRGIECVVFGTQVDAVDAMEKTIWKNYPDYKPIEKSNFTSIEFEESHDFFAGIGVSGHVIKTDYHSPDSITFVSVDGEAVIGDLPPQDQMMPDDDTGAENWQTVWEAGGRTAYPGHALPFVIPDPAKRR